MIAGVALAAGGFLLKKAFGAAVTAAPVVGRAIFSKTGLLIGTAALAGQQVLGDNGMQKAGELVSEVPGQVFTGVKNMAKGAFGSAPAPAAVTQQTAGTAPSTTPADPATPQTQTTPDGDSGKLLQGLMGMVGKNPIMMGMMAIGLMSGNNMTDKLFTTLGLGILGYILSSFLGNGSFGHTPQQRSFNRASSGVDTILRTPANDPTPAPAISAPAPQQETRRVPELALAIGH